MTVYNIIGAQFTIYIGTFLFITGLVGNLLNACVFHMSNLRNPSIFLLFVSSCASLIYLITSLLTRVLLVGFSINTLGTTLVWCKIRLHMGQVAWFISISCICYAVIDRFFVSSREEKWRRRSQLSITRRITCIIVLFWLLHAIPILIFPDRVFNDNGRFHCDALIIPYFKRYITYFLFPILATTAPISLLTIFGFLTYRNLNSLKNIQHRQKAQRPLTSMILLQTVFIVIASVPIALHHMYTAITSTVVKSADQKAMEILLLDIAIVLYGFPHASSFFAYSLSSSAYRQQLKQLLHLSSCRRHLLLVPIISVAAEQNYFANEAKQ